MLSSLGITHHVSPTSTLFFGGRKTRKWLAEKEADGTAGLFQERRPLRELWDTCKQRNPLTQFLKIRGRSYSQQFSLWCLAAFTKSALRQRNAGPNLFIYTNWFNSKNLKNALTILKNCSSWEKGHNKYCLTPRNPSLLFVIESSSRGCILASKLKVSPSGSGITSSSKSTGGVLPAGDHKNRNQLFILSNLAVTFGPSSDLV